MPFDKMKVAPSQKRLGTIVLGYNVQEYEMRTLSKMVTFQK